MTDFNDSELEKMEKQVTKYLKSWLKVTRLADPSILYRGTCGLNITRIKDAFLASRANTEITLCTSLDPVVRATAKRRREKDITSKNQTPQKDSKELSMTSSSSKSFAKQYNNPMTKEGLEILKEENK